MPVVIKTTNGNYPHGGNNPSSEPNDGDLMEGITNKREITPEETIAAISLQALIRHQNHRKMKIRPVPAPKTNNKLNN